MKTSMGTAVPRALRAWFVSAALAAPVLAAAQTPAPTAPVPPGGQAPPVVVKFPQAGVGLSEVVRLTLEHQPAIDLAETNVSRQEAVAQEQKGAFDWTLSSRLFYSYRQQELPEARKEIERNKRAQLRKNIEENRTNAANAQTLLTQLRAVGGAPVTQAQYDAIAAIDPQLAAELRIIDTLIGTNPGAANALRQERNQLISRVITQLDRGLVEALDNFRTSEQTLANLGEAPSDELFYQFNGTAQLSKAYRNGIQFSPYVQHTIEYSNFLDKPRETDFGGKGIEPIYTTRAGINTVIPLLRGRGANATGGAERAALIEVDATRLALRHQADLSTLETVRAYWDLRAAQANFEVTETSVKNQQRLVELTAAQAKDGSIPAIEVARSRAAEARARGRLEDASRALQEAQARLLDTMGLTASDDPATLPRALDDFPATPAPADLTAPAIAAAVGVSGDRRNDIQAALVSERAGRALTDTLGTFTRSKLDLNTKVWWTALDDLVNFVQDPARPNDPTARVKQKEGFAGTVDRWVGPSLEASLDFERPLANNAAEGRLAQQRAELRRREITANDLRRLARLGVVRSARSLVESIDRVRAAEESVRFYEQTIQGDFERFRAGDITALDTIITVEQQVDALLSLVAARRDVAKLIAEMRFESGQLVTHEAGKPPVADRNNLTTVPRVGGR